MDTSEPRAEQAEPPDGEDRLRSALSSVQEISGARERVAVEVTRADKVSAAVLGLGYLVAALGCAAAAEVASPGDLLRMIGLIALYVVAYRTEFVAAGGSTVPTEPILVGMLLLLPLPLVPTAILAGLLLGSVGDLETGHQLRDLVARMISGWHCLGPVLVLTLLPVDTPDLSRWPVYLLALAAQFGFDAASALARAAALGVRPGRLAGPLGWTFMVDSLLAPLGLCVVIAAVDVPVALALLAAPVGLIRLLARDRSEQLENAMALGTAFSAVREEARVDVLTGLANRRAWSEALRDVQQRVLADPGLVAVALVADVDGLKRINDDHGHDAGDELIQAIARTIADAAPHGAVTARLGGDEFGVLFAAPADPDLAAMFSLRVRSALDRAPRVHEQALSASLGTGASPPARTVADAVSLADLAAAADKVARKVGRA
jgi:diguanylate cyclase (GGDEF)-like protein